MTLTIRELAGLGSVADAFSRKRSRLSSPSRSQPTQEEIEKYGELRPGLSDQEVASAENELRSALLDLDRVAEQRRRCLSYPNSNRKPEHYGFSPGCGSEQAAFDSATRRVELVKARVKDLRDRMQSQRMESYEVDLRQDERNAAITYVRGIPVRDASALARPAPVSQATPSRSSGGLLVAASLAALAIFALSR